MGVERLEARLALSTFVEPPNTPYNPTFTLPANAPGDNDYTIQGTFQANPPPGVNTDDTHTYVLTLPAGAKVTLTNRSDAETGYYVDVTGTGGHVTLSPDVVALPQTGASASFQAPKTGPYQIAIDPGGFEPGGPFILDVALSVARIVPTGLKFTSDGGVDFGYKISSDLPKATTVDLYWSPTATFSSTTATLIQSAEIETETAQGSYGTFSVTRSALGAAPSRTNYLLVVADPRNLVSAADPSKVIAQALPSLDIQSIAWDPDTLASWTSDPNGSGGIHIQYSVDKAPLPAFAPVAVYWAKGPSLTDILGGPITTGADDQPILTGSDQASYPLHVPSMPLGLPPKGTKDLLVILDPRTDQHPYGQFVENPSQINVKAFPITTAGILNGSVHYASSGIYIGATFMPAEGDNPPAPNEPAQGALSLDQAARLLGVDHFNWLQQITHTPATLKPFTFIYPPADLFAVTTKGLQPVIQNTGGTSTIDTKTTATAYPHPAPFPDPIVPYGQGDTQQYVRGLVVRGKYAILFKTDGQNGDPPPPDRFYYYYNEPASKYDNLSGPPTTLLAALNFFDRPFISSFNDPLHPAQVITPYDNGGYLAFATSLVGVVDDKSNQDFKLWSGYHTGFTWDDNATTSGGGVYGLLSAGVGTVASGASSVTSGGVFNVQASDSAPATDAPSLQPISVAPAALGKTVTFVASASDPVDGSLIRYSLDPGAPAGARIDPTTGAFSWTPTAPGTYAMTVRVTDNGSPPLSVAQPFTITVTSASSKTVSSSALISDLTAPVYGESQFFGAAVATVPALGAPSGTLQFYVDGVRFGAPVPMVNGGANSPSIAALGAGVHYVQAVYSGDANYASIATPVLTEAVAKAPLLVVANGSARVYGQPNFPLMASYYGFVNGDTPASLTSPSVVATFANQFSPIGTYAIAVAGATSRNYAITFLPGTLTVLPTPAGATRKLLADSAYVTTLYEEVLGRTPDITGFHFWVQMLDRGVSEAAVASAFWKSPEHVVVVASGHAPLIPQAAALRDAQTAAWIAFVLGASVPAGPLG